MNEYLPDQTLKENNLIKYIESIKILRTNHSLLIMNISLLKMKLLLVSLLLVCSYCSTLTLNSPPITDVLLEDKF